MMQSESLEHDVADLTESCRSLFEQEAMSGVDHYLDHGEPEMAFEGLLIELIKVNRYPNPFDADRWESVARACGLLDGGVFDAGIWDKFCVWKESQVGQTPPDEMGEWPQSP